MDPSPPNREAPPNSARPGPGAVRAVRPVILFDGVCNLCNAMVRWVVEHDVHGHFRFAPLQSEEARRLLSAAGADVGCADAVAGDAAPRGAKPDSAATPPGSNDTVALVDQDGVHLRSAAAIRVAKRLDFPWSLLGWLSVAPRPLRDAAYDFVARNRYRWFGRRATCPVPGPGLAERFLDSE